MMKYTRQVNFFPMIMILLLVINFQPARAQGYGPGKPKLVILIIIDQFRAGAARDLANRDTGGALQQLYARGIVYENALFDYATTSTGPGHATLATGALPSAHGIISNYWLHPQSLRPTTSTADPETSILDLDEFRRGHSPRQLLVPALADRIIEASAGKARAIGVSIKERGAIFTAGKSGKAYWFANAYGKFVTSSYYYDEYTLPEWLRQFNATLPDELPRRWELLYERDSYRFSKQDDRRYERPPKGMKKIFPHPLGNNKGRNYYKRLRHSPWGDLITLKLAGTVIEQEQLGQDTHTDLLTVSLSATDFIGHAFGPGSLEMEDNLYRLDLALNGFITLLEQKFSRQEFLLVLTADHGVNRIAETIAGADPDATRIYPGKLTRGLNRYLKKTYKIRDNLVRRIIPPNVYFNTGAISKRGLHPDDVEQSAAAWLQQQPTIARAIPIGRLPECMDDELCRLIRNSYYAGRSGEIYIVQGEAAVFSMEPAIDAANHGSPYKWDRHVPVVFYGMNLLHQSVKRIIRPGSITPTIAAILGLAPLASDAEQLTEVLN